MRDLTSGPEGRLIFYFAVPMLIGNLFQLRGAGDTLTPMLVTLIALWVVRVPVATLLSRRLGTDGVWLATPVGWAVGMILILSWYAGGLWKRKTLSMGASAARRQSHG